MIPITVRVSDEMDRQLTILASETDRKKGDLVRRALESYLEEKSDLVIALSRLERGEGSISLDELEKKYDLED